MNVKRAGFWIAIVCGLLSIANVDCLAQSASSSLGAFDGQTDVGSVSPPGSALYDSAKDAYTVQAAGANMWSTTDAFHFAWKKLSGDVAIAANITFAGSEGTPDPHRKAVLIFRQNLDADGVYVDAAQHGSGMTAVQYRTERGATTQDVELNIEAPRRIRLEKRGDTFTLFVSNHGEPLHQVGASTKLHLKEPFYAGIGVCSHNPAREEKAMFSNLKMEALHPGSNEVRVYSALQTIGIEDSFRRAMVVATAPGRMEAPNWSRDGKTLIFVKDGKMWTVPADGGAPSLLDTGAATKCTGSHGLSPDGKLLAISCSMPDKPETRVYIVPSTGGEPRVLTENPWSYFHSWSPDGKTIAFTRPDHKGGGNINVIPVEGGAEKALTSGGGISDDPDYSSDGQWIYFNSDRGGSMKIWKMRPDGSDAEQVTHDDDFNDWTPHPSPDGKSILILSYGKEVRGHPTDTDVALRILNVADGKIRVLVNVVGGAGSDNVPNWAPDGTHFAFVAFQKFPEESAEGGAAH